MSETETSQQNQSFEPEDLQTVESEDLSRLDTEPESGSPYGRPPTNRELWMVVVIIVVLFGVLIAQHGL